MQILEDYNPKYLGCWFVILVLNMPYCPFFSSSASSGQYDHCNLIFLNEFISKYSNLFFTLSSSHGNQVGFVLLSQLFYFFSLPFTQYIVFYSQFIPKQIYNLFSAISGESNSISLQKPFCCRVIIFQSFNTLSMECPLNFYHNIPYDYLYSMETNYQMLHFRQHLCLSVRQKHISSNYFGIIDKIMICLIHLSFLQPDWSSITPPKYTIAFKNKH